MWALLCLFIGAAIGVLGAGLCASARCGDCDHNGRVLDDKEQASLIKRMLDPRSRSVVDPYAMAARNAIRAYSIGIVEVDPDMARKLDGISIKELNRAFDEKSKS